MWKVKCALPLAFILQAILGGCGLTVPEKELFVNDNVEPPQPSPSGLRENDIIAHIRCEIRLGVWKARQLRNVKWLDKWASKVNLTMTVAEQSDINPGVSVIQPFENAVKVFPVNGNVTASQSFNVGLGITTQAHTTRKEQIEFTFSHAKLIEEATRDESIGTNSCDVFKDGVLINGDLKIGQFIYDKAVAAGAAGEATTKSVTTPPYSVFSDDITFVLAYGGSITPTWTFLRTSVGTSSTHTFDAQRSLTNEILITLAEETPPSPGLTNAPPQLSPDGNMVHNANLIGSATAASIQSLTR